MQEPQKQLSTAKQAAFLSISILFALATFLANAGKEGANLARVLGVVSSPFIVGLLAAGIIRVVMKAAKKPARSFADYFIIATFVFTLLTILSRIGNMSSRY